MKPSFLVIGEGYLRPLVTFVFQRMTWVDMLWLPSRDVHANVSKARHLENSQNWFSSVSMSEDEPEKVEAKENILALIPGGLVTLCISFL